MEINNRCSSAVLRVMSKELSIQDISLMFNINPTRCHAKGDLHSKRNPQSKIREENLLIFDSGINKEEPLEIHIEKLLSLLKDSYDNIKKNQELCEVEIMCSYSSSNGQGGFWLSHNLIKELSLYPIELIVNLYPPCNDE